MRNQIILIAGGTGVGTTSYAFELSKALYIPLVVSTDAIREVIRNTIAYQINPTLAHSTYTAGQTKHYPDKDEGVKHAEIIRGFKFQAASVMAGVEAIVKRSIKENKPAIVEGVHLIPGKIHESPVYQSNHDRFVEYAICIDSPVIHRSRLELRAKEAPDRTPDSYTKNFTEIRWIHDYLVDRTKRYPGILLVENSGIIQESLEKRLDFYHAQRNRIR